jgi:hypothetical protein
MLMLLKCMDLKTKNKKYHKFNRKHLFIIINKQRKDYRNIEHSHKEKYMIFLSLH